MPDSLSGTRLCYIIGKLKTWYFFLTYKIVDEYIKLLKNRSVRADARNTMFKTTQYSINSSSFSFNRLFAK